MTKYETQERANMVSQDLVKTLAHHDVAIGSLGSRMTGVETGLATLDHKVGEGFLNLSSLIREEKAAKGPGLGEIMKIIATGGAIIGMSAAGITMLVTSFTSPELTSLKEKTEEHEKSVSGHNEAEREELRELRTRWRTVAESKIDQLLKEVSELREKYGWVGRVEPSGGKK